MINQFSYRLKSSTGKYYRVSGSTLELVNEVVELQHTPDGWRDKTINWKRNWERFGVLRSFTIPMQFVLNGADVVKKLFIEYGFEADCLIEICEINNSTRLYEPIFIGEVDFSLYESQVNFTSVNFIEGGAQKLLKANEDTVYEIPIEDTDCIRVHADGVNIYSKLSYQFIQAGEISSTPQLVPLGFINGEGENVALARAEQIYLGPAPDYTTSGEWLFKALQNVSVRIRGKWRESIKDRNGTSGTFSVDFKTNTGRTINLVSGSVVATGSQYNYDIDKVIEFEKDEVIFLQMDPFQGSDFLKYGFIDALTFEFVSRKETSDIKAYSIHQVFHKLCAKIGVIGKSDLLAGLASQNLSMAFTSLNGLVANDENVIKTSFKELFQFTFSVLSSCSYIDSNDSVRIETIAQAFDQTQILDIGEVSNLVHKPYTEKIFNKIDVGYTTENIEEVNGKYIFNAKQQWINKNKRNKNTLDLMAPYITDPYVIEITRIKQSGKTTTDNSKDNKVFVFHIDEQNIFAGDGYSSYGLYRPEVLKTITPDPPNPPIETYFPPVYNGVLDNTVFNFELSPRHNLLRNAKLLASLMWKTNGVISLESSEKNKDIELHTLFDSFIERDDVNVSATSKLFIPVLLSFDSNFEGNLFSIMAANSRGFIKFDYMGDSFYGFADEINIQPHDGSTKTWNLVCAPQTDLNKLVELTSICEAVGLQYEAMEIVQGEAYERQIQLTGTPNIILSNIQNLPTGMNLHIIANKLVLSGTSSVFGLFMLSFTLSNCGGNRDFTIPVTVVANAPINNLSVDEVLIETATISWDATGYATEVSLRRDGVLLPGYPTTVSSSADSFQFLNLEANSNYEAAVRKKIGFNFSAYNWTYFTTAKGCFKYRWFAKRNPNSYMPNPFHIYYEDCSGVVQHVVIPILNIGEESKGEFCAQKIIQGSEVLTRDGLCGGAGPTCIPVNAGGLTPNYTGATVLFYGEIVLSGTPPFGLIVNSVSGWITNVDVSGNKIIIQGDPGGVQENGFINITVTNCEGASKIINETIIVYP